jgi:hypothetical protein
MKTQITISKKTLAQILTQARSLGVSDRTKDGLKTIACEVEKPDGKRVFVRLPCRLTDWLKNFDSPPTMGIAVGKQSIEAITFSSTGKAFTKTEVCAGYIVKANATEGKRTSRLSCVVKRVKQGFAVSVFLRIDAQGVVSCVERVAKLSKVECAHEKKFKRASVLSESHGGKWLLVKSAGAIWSLVFQPFGMAGVAVAVSNLGGRGMTEADAIEEAGKRLTDEVKDRILKHQWDKACELAEKAEREAREELGEEVADIVKATKPSAVEVVPIEVAVEKNDNTRIEGITEHLPVAHAVIESVTVLQNTRNEGITEEKQWEKACAAKVALESAKLKKACETELARLQRKNDMAWNQFEATQAEVKREDLTGKRFTCPGRYNESVVFVVLGHARADKWICYVEGVPCSQVHIYTSELVPVIETPACVAVAQSFTPRPSQDTVTVKLQSENEAQGMVCAYSTVSQLPPVTVTPIPLPLATARASQKTLLYCMAQYGVAPCNYLRNGNGKQGNLRSAIRRNRLQSARKTGPPLKCFNLLIAASPSVGIAYYLYPLRGNYG